MQQQSVPHALFANSGNFLRLLRVPFIESSSPDMTRRQKRRLKERRNTLWVEN